MIRLPIVLIAGLFLALFAERANAAAAGRRVALVVGVGAYQSVARLPNATNDSAAMAEMFRKAGFDVVTARSDVGNLEFKRAIREFEDTVNDADIAVIFYAGHGIEVRDVNYLIPADAKLANERDVEDEAITLDRLITALEPAKRLRLIILDACRDNPFSSKMKRRVATRAVSGGLSKVEPASSDTLIAYAAKDKSVAADGDGEHSPFTTALLNNLTLPGLDVRLAFGRIRDEVLRATGRKQEPFVYGSLGGGTMALVPQAADPVPAGNPLLEAAQQKADYELVERVGKREAWEVFLNTHKVGLYADLARVQLAKLGEGENPMRTAIPGAPVDSPIRVAPRVDTPYVAPAPKPTAEETKTWDRLKSSSDRAAIRKFLERYGSSPLAPLAQDRLDLLDRLAREREDALKAEREAAKQREEEEARARVAEVERKRLEREAMRQREAEARAKAAEVERQKAEALAAMKQREAEDRARVAEALAKAREAEAAARAAAIAERERQAADRARAAEAARLAAEAAKTAEREEIARRQKAEDEARALAAKDKLHSDEAAKAVADAERQRREREATAAAASEQAQAKASEIERQKAEQALAAQKREAEVAAKAAADAREKADVAAVAERQKAAEAAKTAAARQREAQAAAERRQAAEASRKVAEQEAAASRRKAAEASRKAAERQAEREAAVAERRRREARQAREIARPVVARPAPAAPRHEAARPVSRPAGGAASMVGIGF